MSRVYTDTLEPRKPTQDITLGTAGETISVGANSINVNTVKDKGGNTLWTSNGSGVLSSVNSALKGNLALLTTNTFTDAASSAFTTLIDSTYDVYIFKFNAINPATDGTEKFQIQFSTDGGSSYGMTKTTSVFAAWHSESGVSVLELEAGWDRQQSTSAQWLMTDLGAGADECGVGELYLFSPSNTTYVKHFYATTQYYYYSNQSVNQYTSGYINSTDNVDAVKFTMTSGNMDGEIKMYGISKS